MKTHAQRLSLEALEDRTLLATCTVTNLLDVGRGGMSIGSGQVTGDLRFCINHANALPGPDVIAISATGTINLTRALPDLASDIDIQGPGADVLTVRRGTTDKYRIFTIADTASVQISGLTVTNGFVHSVTFNPPDLGGGILNAGTLVLRDCVITANEAWSQFNGTGQGGGIYNSGDLTVIDSTVSNNWAHGDESLGGGIANAAAGSVSVYNSTISSNRVSGSWLHEGGGLHNNGGFMFLINSTVSGNTANHQEHGRGGGISAWNGQTVISHSTISGNDAFNGHGGGISTHLGNYGVATGPVFIRNSIIGSNVGGDIAGPLTSSDHNLVANSAGGSGYAPTDILDVDPMLGPLQDNGGPTLTMALLPGSPAIDAGDNADAPEFDQRGPGFPRIVNDTIDIGAFEVQSTSMPRSAYLITAESQDDLMGLIPCSSFSPGQELGKKESHISEISNE